MKLLASTWPSTDCCSHLGHELDNGKLFYFFLSLSLFLLPLKKIVKENGCLKIDLKDQKKSNFPKLKGTKETRKSNAKIHDRL